MSSVSSDLAGVFSELLMLLLPLLLLLLLLELLGEEVVLLFELLDVVVVMVVVKVVLALLLVVVVVAMGAMISAAWNSASMLSKSSLDPAVAASAPDRLPFLLFFLPMPAQRGGHKSIATMRVCAGRESKSVAC
jgi:hypothetical protein